MAFQKLSVALPGLLLVRVRFGAATALSGATLTAGGTVVLHEKAPVSVAARKLLRFQALDKGCGQLAGSSVIAKTTCRAQRELSVGASKANDGEQAAWRRMLPMRTWAATSEKRDGVCAHAERGCLLK